MATMKDVARLAGVSTPTVSHVINKDRFVSEAITAKVE
ncbi:TPA: LacI family DNA-binding transcriptional regulator, partial [Escherichia coli]|nr:LacI family DNA-binding transcriptional regulator [Escherichia coli]